MKLKPERATSAVPGGLGRAVPTAVFCGDLARDFSAALLLEVSRCGRARRASSLRLNYRTSYRSACRLPAAGSRTRGRGWQCGGTEGDVVDFNGPPPTIWPFQRIRRDRGGSLMAAGPDPEAHQVGIFVRSERSCASARGAEVPAPFKILDGNVGHAARASIAPCIVPRDWNFVGVVVMACDDEVIPLQERIEPSRRRRSGRSLQHRTSLALCRLYPAGSSAGDERRPGVRNS